MKILLVGLLLIGSAALAEIRDMNMMLAKASPDDTKNLGLLLKNLSIEPTQEKHKGKPLFKVKKVEKGSFWEKQGLKPGDFVTQ